MKRGKVSNVVIMGRATQKVVPTHSQLQISCMDWVRAKHPELAKCFVKISNEGKRSWQEGKKQKSEGLCKGASDIFFAKPKKISIRLGEPDVKYCGLWIEFKTHDDKESKEQAEFGSLMLQNGYGYAVVYSVDEFIHLFEDYIHR